MEHCYVLSILTADGHSTALIVYADQGDAIDERQSRMNNPHVREALDLLEARYVVDAIPYLPVRKR